MSSKTQAFWGVGREVVVVSDRDSVTRVRHTLVNRGVVAF